MSALLEKAFERLQALVLEDRDSMAAQILSELEDERGSRERFALKRDVIRPMAQEALDEDARGETLPLSDLL
jgi:hypothetical protein